MERFPAGTVVRVYQEDWWPFQNLPAAFRAFEAATGVRVELGWDTAGHDNIEVMWDRMIRSFTDDEPAFDLVCADELVLQQYAALGRIQPLDAWVARDGYDLADFRPAALAAASQDGQLYGLPCVNVTNLLLYRADLFNKYDIPVPQSFIELRVAAAAIQEAVRKDTGNEDFYGFTTRGAAGAGYGIWPMCSNWAASWGVDWYDGEGRPTIDAEAHRWALDAYVQLLTESGPPESPEMSFVEIMRAYEVGRAAMVLEVGMEFAHMLGKGGPIAERSGVTLVPFGPTGRRHAGLYAPPYAIPTQSRVKDAAFELAKFLCSKEQLIEDGLYANAIESSRPSVLADGRFAGRFRADLVDAVRRTHAECIVRGERPVSRHGLAPLAILGTAYNQALRHALTSAEALSEAQRRIEALGSRW